MLIFDGEYYHAVTSNYVGRLVHLFDVEVRG